MIDNYNDIINDWGGGCCGEMVDIISPDCSMSQWAIQKTVTVLANSDYYYTKDEVDYLLKQVTTSGVTISEVEAMINAAIADKANKSDVEALSGQVEANTESIQNTYTKGQTDAAINAATSGKVDNSVYTAYTASTAEEISGKASTGDIATLFGGVAYDSNSKRINFYHGSTGGTVLAYIDATDFIKDGMVDNVEIKTISGTTYLAITFNSDAGKEEIDVPLTDIFDPNNYYNKNATDAAISEATSGKADTSAVTSVNNVLTAHTADTSIHVTSNDKTTWNDKQDALVNQVNIKSINGSSLLGSGDLQVQSQPTISGTTLIFS